MSDDAEKQRRLQELQAQLQGVRQQQAAIGQHQQQQQPPQYHQQHHHHQHHHHHHHHHHHGGQGGYGGHHGHHQHQQQQQHRHHHYQHQHQQHATVHDVAYEDDEYDEYDEDMWTESSHGPNEAEAFFEAANAKRTQAAAKDDVFQSMLTETTVTSASIPVDEIFELAKFAQGPNAEQLAQWGERGHLKAARDNKDRTVLHYLAEQNGADELIAKLVPHMPANAKDEDGITAADVAVIAGIEANAAALGGDMATRGETVQRFRTAPPKFQAFKSAAKIVRPSSKFWGRAPIQPSPSFAFAATDLGDTSAAVPTVDNAPPAKGVSPLQWTKNPARATPEYHASVHALSVTDAKSGKVAAAMDVHPVGRVVHNGQPLAQLAYLIDNVAARRDALLALLQGASGYLNGCIAGYLTDREVLKDKLPPTSAVKWYQRSIHSLDAMAGASRRDLFPDLATKYSVTRCDIMRRHEVIPDASAWRMATIDDTDAVAASFQSTASAYEVSFEASAEAIGVLAFQTPGARTLISQDGASVLIMRERDAGGTQSLIVSLASLASPTLLESACAAVRELRPEVTTLYVPTIAGLSEEAALKPANFVAIPESNRNFYLVASPSEALPPVAGSKVRYPVAL